MRAIPIAGAVIFAFIAIMYLRFSGDAVPSPEPMASPIARSDGGVCFPARRADGQAAPTLSGRDPCATLPPLNPLPPEQIVITPPEPRPPELLQGRRIHELKLGSDIEAPQGVALIVETGCMQCDGPTTGLSRVYLDAHGKARLDSLFTPDKVGMGPQVIQTEKGPEEMRPSIASWAAARDGSDIAVVVCSIAHSCFPGSPNPTAEYKIFRSLNGGVTWIEFGMLESGARLLGSTAYGEYLAVVHRQTTTDPESPIQPAYFLYPSLEEIRPPARVGGASWPFVSPDGDIVWDTAAGIFVRQNGTPFLANASLDRQHFQREIFRDLNLYLVAFTYTADETYISLVTPDGEPDANFSVPGYLRLGGMASRTQVFVNVTVTDLVSRDLPSPFVGWLPAVVDLEAGTFHPITGPFLEPPLLNGRNQILAVQQGPFARVVNTDGTCLNIRAEPGSGAALDCAAEGVLLRDLAQSADVAGVAWIRIATPAGVEGWASTQYLER